MMAFGRGISTSLQTFSHASAFEKVAVITDDSICDRKVRCAWQNTLASSRTIQNMNGQRAMSG